jgi:hypothetical protein
MLPAFGTTDGCRQSKLLILSTTVCRVAGMLFDADGGIAFTFFGGMLNLLVPSKENGENRGTVLKDKIYDIYFLQFLQQEKVFFFFLIHSKLSSLLERQELWRLTCHRSKPHTTSRPLSAASREVKRPPLLAVLSREQIKSKS